VAVWDGLDIEAYDRNYSDTELIRRIQVYFGTQKKRLIWLTVAVIVIVVAELAVSLIISQGLSALTANPTDLILGLLAGILLFATVSSWAANWLRRRMAGRAIGDIVRDLRTDAFKSAVSRDMSFYDEFASGKIVSRITSDTQDFAQMIVLVTDLVSQLMVLIILVMILLTIDWKLTLLISLMVPAVLSAALAFRSVARRVSQRASRMLANVNSNIQESIAGISVAKNFRQERNIYDEFLKVSKQSFRVYLRRGVILAMVYPTLHIIAGLGTALLLYFGAKAVLSGLITVGAWFLFLQSVYKFWDPLSAVASFWSQFQAGLASAERIFALIDAPNVVVQQEQQPVPSLRGEIKFDHLKFQYSDQQIVLPDFSLNIAAGETIAFVGHTGAGKSSLAKLVARFYEFQDGQLLVDNHDIRTLDLGEYRRHLGIVSQTPFLFAGSVIDNIRYARPEATDAEIEAMAHQIGSGEWVETLPQGLKTDVGERGARLSMGQRQLVALTRVLVQAPSIFILDEATASIDLFTESQIQQALNMILARSTSILIAHRLSTVRSADRIIVLKNGEIIEQGNHDSLMASGNHYAELYNTYFRHQSLEYIESAKAR
jgi:ATP-binding cassette, subfamily B, bacterial